MDAARKRRARLERPSSAAEHRCSCGARPPTRLRRSRRRKVLRTARELCGAESPTTEAPGQPSVKPPVEAQRIVPECRFRVFAGAIASRALR